MKTPFIPDAKVAKLTKNPEWNALTAKINKLSDRYMRLAENLLEISGKMLKESGFKKGGYVPMDPIKYRESKKISRQMDTLHAQMAPLFDRAIALEKKA